MTAYNISKYGMTMCALGVAGEYGPDSPEDPGITANSLWPATVVESQASINFELGDTSTWRKATVLADSVVAICGEGDDFTGAPHARPSSPNIHLARNSLLPCSVSCLWRAAWRVLAMQSAVSGQRLPTVTWLTVVRAAPCQATC